MYFKYLYPVALLFFAIIVFKVALKISAKKVEGFEEGDNKQTVVPNDEGVKLLYEIRGMVLNNQNEIDKQIQALNDKKDTSVVIDKMSELEDLLKGVRKTTTDIDPLVLKKQVEDKEDDKDSDDDSDDESTDDENEDEDEEDPKEKKVDKPKANDKDKEDTEKKPKKGKKNGKRKADAPKQLVDDSEDEDENSGDVVENFVDGIEYYSSATNCYEVN